MKIRIIKFAIVGGIGFIVDVSALAMLSSFVPIIPARAGAFWVAASSTWWCNRIFTFKESERSEPVQQWCKFLFCACIGFLPNWGCYWFLIKWTDFSWITHLVGQHAAVLWPYIAMIPGILLGMAVNFTLSSRWVFRQVEA